MKYFIALCLLSPIYARSQDCKLNRETDPYTKETKVSTGFIELTGGSVTIDADSKEIDFFFSVDGRDKCFDNNCMAAVYFEGTKVKMSSRNSGSMNCEGFFHFTFRNAATITSMLQKLSTQHVTSVVFTGSNKKETTLTLTPVQQSELRDMTNCLVNEAKKLVK